MIRTNQRCWVVEMQVQSVPLPLCHSLRLPNRLSFSSIKCTCNELFIKGHAHKRYVYEMCIYIHIYLYAEFVPTIFILSSKIDRKCPMYPLGSTQLASLRAGSVVHACMLPLLPVLACACPTMYLRIFSRCRVVTSAEHICVRSHCAPICDRSTRHTHTRINHDRCAEFDRTLL